MRGALGCSLSVCLVLVSQKAAPQQRPPAAASEAAGSGPTTWLVVTGGALLGGSYLISFGMASAGQGCGNAFLGMDCVPRHDVPGTDWPLFVPLVGPFIALATSEDRPAYALALLGAGQVAGAAVLVSGLAWRRPLGQTTGLLFSPSIQREAAGLLVVGNF